VHDHSYPDNRPYVIVFVSALCIFMDCFYGLDGCGFVGEMSLRYKPTHCKPLQCFVLNDLDPCKSLYLRVDREFCLYEETQEGLTYVWQLGRVSSGQSPHEGLQPLFEVIFSNQ